MHPYETTRRNLHTLALAALLLLTPAAAAPAAEYVVPDDPGCGTILDCIAQAAYAGDTIRVRPGTYAEAVDFLGKAVTLVSDEGPENTIIEGGEGEATVTFRMGEGRGSVLRGFTVDDGIACTNASPSIIENVITGYGSGAWGAAVDVQGYAAPLIESNRFEDLRTYCGICCEGGLPSIVNNSFDGSDSENMMVVIGVYSTDIPETLRITGNQISWFMGPEEFRGIELVGDDRKDGEGGGRTRSPVLVQGNTVFGCMAGAWGWGHAYTRGISVRGFENVVVSENRIWRNLASAFSRDPALMYGIELADFGEAVVANNLVAANAAEGMVRGTTVGIRLADGAGAGVSHNTVSGNYATDGFGYGYSAGIEGGTMTETLEVRNNIVTDNARPAGLPGGPIRGLVLDQPAGLLADWNDVMGHEEDYAGLEPGPHDLSVDPLFVDPDSGDYHLQPGSPCVDRGTDAGVVEDLDGDPRPIGLGFDMGADEVADPCPGAPGDVNHDGAVDVTDGLMAFGFALGLRKPGPCEFRRADVVVDGRVTTGDAACIYRFAHGLPSCLD